MLRTATNGRLQRVDLSGVGLDEDIIGARTMAAITAAASALAARRETIARMDRGETRSAASA